MNNERTGNILICIISSLFFICIIVGGIFLSLYIFLPETESSPPTSHYLLIGMILVATPWLFWIVTFSIRCCCLHSSDNNNKDRYFAKTNSNHANNNNNQQQHQQQQHLDVSPAANNVNSTGHDDDDDDGKSPIMTNSPTGDRRVHFGPVIVLGTDNNGNQLGVPGGDQVGSDSSNMTGSTKSNEDHSIASTDSERPLACFAVPSS